jgi:hypothetical protein
MGQRGIEKRISDLRQKAEKSRFIARQLSLRDDRERLEQYARELDQQADELERRSVPAKPVTQEQQQVQQQQQRPKSDGEDEI